VNFDNKPRISGVYLVGKGECPEAPADQKEVFNSARFLDSIIVGDGHYFSFCDEGLLKK
jgi:hypothetical protein